MKINTERPNFSNYQIRLIIVLALVQLTNMLDFMIISPLGAHLNRVMGINSSRFGFVVSAYAFTAALSGLFTALFADKYDRRKLLIFFYTGFITGTFLCGFANTYVALLLSRIITGAFGGVIASVIFTIITDMFDFQVRGRVISFVQISFSASQAIGIPFALFLTNRFDWHLPFLSIAIFSSLLLFLIFIWIRPMKPAANFKGGNYKRLLGIIAEKNYWKAYACTGLLVIGGFLIMPYVSIFLVHNVSIPENRLSIIYMIAGISTIITAPLVGKLSDKFGKYTIFIIGSAILIIMLLIYTSLIHSTLWIVILIFSILYISVSSRMISGMALITKVPRHADRGSFMSISSSVQQLAGGLAAAAGGLIVYQNDAGRLINYSILGVITVTLVILSLFLMKRILDQDEKSKY